MKAATWLLKKSTNGKVLWKHNAFLLSHEIKELIETSLPTTYTLEQSFFATTTFQEL